MSANNDNQEKPKQDRTNLEPPKSWRFLLWYALIAFWLVWLWQFGFQEGNYTTLTYSEFKQHLAAGELEECVIKTDTIEGVINPPDEGAADEVGAFGDDAQQPDTAEATSEAAQEELGQEEGEGPPTARAQGPRPPSYYDDDAYLFRATRVEDPDLVKELEAANVRYWAEKPNPIVTFMMTWILPIGLLVLLWIFLMRWMGRGAGSQVMTFGKSKAKIVAERATGVHFNDVAGCDEAKQELEEVVDFLKDPGRYQKLGANIPKGVLLVGPPGTGKTLMARAVAGEAGVTFFSLSGSEFVEMFVGVGASRVRDLFTQAKEKAPCIVFIDELDAIGRQRGVHMGGVNDEREQTLNQLLVEMDGFEANTGVIILSATNRPDVLDRALLRPGRFDRQVVLDAPDLNGREAILKVHARGKPMGSDVDLRAVARATPGFSGADLANAINEAALLAVRRRHAEISQADLEEAVEKVVAGPERKSRRLGDEEKRRVAYHEVGHALVAAFSKHADPVHKISIVPRGRSALGYTLQLPTEDQFLMTKEELLDRVKGLLGGRAAEEVVFGEISTGAQNDLQRATAMARQMVCQYGMSNKVGLLHCAREVGGQYLVSPDGYTQRDCSEETAREVDEEVRKILNECYKEASETLVEHRESLEHIASELLQRETIDKETFDKLLKGQEAEEPTDSDEEPIAKEA